MRQNNCDHESKTKLSKIDILAPVQNKIRPSPLIRPESARFEPEENNPELFRGPLVCGSLT